MGKKNIYIIYVFFTEYSHLILQLNIDYNYEKSSYNVK